MELEIHTYGYYDALYHVLNAIAMFRNAEFYPLMLKTVSSLVVCYFGFRMSYTQNSSQWRTYVVKSFGMLVMINALLLPKTEMLIRDHVSKRIGKVDNIPLAFALPVGILESFGHMLTLGFESCKNSSISHLRVREL